LEKQRFISETKFIVCLNQFFFLESIFMRPKTLMEATVFDAFFVTVFRSLRFHLSTLETERFENDAFSKLSTFETVFESLRFHQRFGAFYGRRKPIEKYAFSNENALGPGRT